MANDYKRLAHMAQADVLKLVREKVLSDKKSVHAANNNGRDVEEQIFLLAYDCGIDSAIRTLSAYIEAAQTAALNNS